MNPESKRRFTRRQFLDWAWRLSLELFLPGWLTACAPAVNKPSFTVSSGEIGVNLLGRPEGLSRLTEIVIESDSRIGEPTVAVNGENIVGAVMSYKKIEDFFQSTTDSPLALFRGDAKRGIIEEIFTADKFGENFNQPASDPVSVVLPDGNVGIFYISVKSISGISSINTLVSLVYNPNGNTWTQKTYEIRKANSNSIDKPFAIWDASRNTGWITFSKKYSQSGVGVDLYSFDRDLNLSEPSVLTVDDSQGIVKRGLSVLVSNQTGVHVIYLRRDRKNESNLIYEIFETVYSPESRSIKPEERIIDEKVNVETREKWFSEESLNALTLSDGSIVVTTSAKGNIIVGYLASSENTWKTYKFPVINRSSEQFPWVGFINPVVFSNNQILLTYLAGHSDTDLKGYISTLSQKNQVLFHSKISEPVYVPPPDLNIGDYAHSISDNSNLVPILCLEGNRLRILMLHA